MIYDIAIVGGGPAGLAAALNARRRNLQTVVIGKEEFSSKLTQAHRIDNYPGLPSITGEELARKLRTHAETNGMVFVRDEIQNIYPEEDLFNLYGREHHFQAKTIILATGITLGAEIEGEADFVGRGVSYCATCDGMFFRQKPVAMVGYIREAEAEVRFLAEVCSQVYYLPLYKNPGPVDPRVTLIEGKPVAISGNGQVERFSTTAGTWEVSGVFIERAGRPASQLMDDLAIDEEKFIITDGMQATSIPGIFAAGDCTGKPWQISRAVGQGQVAALSAVRYLDVLSKRQKV
ncbi:MAG TPA: FAD-dependent oxidoreductase [Bacillota bacterium]|nr:FAD-dependent oxidoreductase [Bacillota bacterium]